VALAEQENASRLFSFREQQSALRVSSGEPDLFKGAQGRFRELAKETL
jgi:hypothetical protein